MGYNQVNLSINVDNKLFKLNNKVNLFYNEKVVLCCSLFDKEGNTYAINALDEIELAIDNSLSIRSSNNVMAYSDNSQVDILNDWSLISRANGRFSIRIDTSSALFQTRAKINSFLTIKLKPTGMQNYSVLVQDYVNTYPSVISKFM